MRLLVVLLLNALALYATGRIVPGVVVKSYGAAVIAVLLLAIANTFVRPILILLTLPVTFLTLGLFIFVVNAVIFMIALNVVKGVEVDGFFSGLLGCIVFSILSWLITSLVLGAAPPESPPPN